MTKKLFWKDPYQTRLTTTPTVIDENLVQLSETIFYAASGGQESDSGTIGDIAVTKAEKRHQDIVYTLESAPDFAIGQKVVVVIDWQRRYRLMKLHFAAEVVLELFYKYCTGIRKIGAHISADKSRIDFAWPDSIAELLNEIQHKAQAIFDADLVIESDYSDRAAEQRYWKVDGFATVPCGGTHLMQTSEVGRIALKRKNIGKGKERVEIRMID